MQEHARAIGLDSLHGQFAPFQITNPLTSTLFSRCVGWEIDGSTNPQAPRITTAAALTPYIFFPENTGSDAYQWSAVNAWGPAGKSMGLRYFQTRVVVNTSILDPSFFDYLRVRIVRHSVPLTTQDPVSGLYDNIDATLWTSANLTTADGNWFSGFLYDVTDADFKAPAGTRCYFTSLIEKHYSAGSGSLVTWAYPTPTNLGNIVHWWGPRLDIPFPFLVLGEGNSHAPGGVVSGIVPGYP